MKHSINTQCTLYFVCILICNQYFPIRIFFSQIYFPIASLLGNLLTPHISINKTKRDFFGNHYLKIRLALFVYFVEKGRLPF
jgi:hypothetical protein